MRFIYILFNTFGGSKFMVNMEQSHETTQQPSAERSKRSASYPGLALLEAYNFTVKVYEKFSSEDVTRKEIASAFNRHHSSISRDIAAAAAFGFLDKSLGKGEQEARYKTTSLFGDVYRYENEKEKKIALITAFGKPKLYQELIAKFDGEVIPETLANTLIKHFGITVPASQECAEIFMKSGVEAGVINENRLLNYRVVLSTTSKTQYAEIVEETKNTDVNSGTPNGLPIQLTQTTFSKEAGLKIPIHLTKNKMAYLGYPDDINSKDIKLLEHAIKGILLRLELENDTDQEGAQYLEKRNEDS